MGVWQQRFTALDMNMKDKRIDELEQQLAETNTRITELESVMDSLNENAKGLRERMGDVEWLKELVRETLLSVGFKNRLKREITGSDSISDASMWERLRIMKQQYLRVMELDKQLAEALDLDASVKASLDAHDRRWADYHTQQRAINDDEPAATPNVTKTMDATSSLDFSKLPTAQDLPYNIEKPNPSNPGDLKPPRRSGRKKKPAAAPQPFTCPPGGIVDQFSKKAAPNTPSEIIRANTTDVIHGDAARKLKELDMKSTDICMCGHPREFHGTDELGKSWCIKCRGQDRYHGFVLIVDSMVT